MLRFLSEVSFVRALLLFSVLICLSGCFHEDPDEPIREVRYVTGHESSYYQGNGPKPVPYGYW